MTYNIQLRPSVQGSIQICQPEGEVVFPMACPRENNPMRVDKSGCFPIQRAVIALLCCCQCFVGYLPCGGKLGCQAGNNRVVRRETIGLFPGSANFCQCFIGYLPCGGNWVVRRGTIELFPGSANFGKTSQLFYYHMTNLIQSKSIIQIKI